MAISVSTDILHSSSGKVAKVQQVAGAWQTLATKTDFNTFTTNSTTKQNLSNGQFFYVLDEQQLYKLTVAGFPVVTYTLNSASFGEINTGSFVTNDQTGSFLTSTDTGSFVLVSDTGSFIKVSQTSSMTVLNALTASYLIGGVGSIDTSSFVTNSQTSSFVTNDQTGSFVTNSQTSSFVTNDQTGSFINASQTSSMNVLSALTASYLIGGAGSIDTSSFLTAADTASLVRIDQTSSMSVATASFISDTFISASAARSGFGTATLPSGVLSSSAQIAVEISGAFAEVSGGLAGRITTLETTSGGDVTALNLFTSSIQTQVDNLTAQTSSYLTSADTASFIVVSQTSSMSVATASYIDPTFISASAAAAGFGSGGATATDISALNSFTGSIQGQVDSLTSVTSSYATTGSNTFNGNQTIDGYVIIDNGEVLYVDHIEENTTNAGITFLGGGFGFTFNNNIEVTGSIVATSFTGSLFGTSSWAENAVTASYIDPTFISASAAAAGFGSGGGGGSTPAGTISSSQQISDFNLFIENSQTSSMSVLSASYAVTASLAQTTDEIRFLGKGDNVDYPISFTTVSGGTIPLSRRLYTDNLSGLIWNPSRRAIRNANLEGNVTGSLFGTSSWAENSLTASYIDPTFISASAVAAGFGIPAGTVSSSAQIVTNLVGQDLVVNTITAETYIVSSSITYMTTLLSSGSTIFGDSVDDTHQFTGSLLVLGNVTALSFTGSLFGTSSWAENALTASYIDPIFISASAAAFGFGSGGGGTPSPGTISSSQQITDLGYINQTQTSSMSVATASYSLYAATASYVDGILTLAATNDTSSAVPGSIWFDGTNFYFYQ